MEYAGYVPGNIVDWGAIGKSLNENYKGVQKAWETRAVEAQEMQKEAQKAIDAADQASNETLNTFVSNSANTIRQQLHQLAKDRDSGKIKHSEYKTIYNNLMSSYSNFATKLQTMDQTLAALNKRQQPGEDGSPAQGSPLEGYLAKRAMELRDFNNKETQIGKDGRVLIVNKSNPGDIFDASTLANVENLYDNRLNLTSAIEKNVEPLGKSIIEKASASGIVRSIEDLASTNEYKNVEADIIFSIANPNDPRAIANVLTANSSGQYSFYTTENEKQQLISEAIAKKELATGEMTEDQRKEFGSKYLRENLIQVVDQNGVMQPVINEDHIRKAHEVVRNGIRVQLDKSIKESRPFAPSSPSGDGNNTVAPGGPTYPRLINAWQEAGTTKNPGDPVASANTFSALAKGKYTFKWGKGGLEIYKGTQNYDPEYQEYSVNEKIATVDNLDDLAPYFYGYSEAKGVGPGLSQYDLEKREYNANKPSSSAKPQGGATATGGNAR